MITVITPPQPFLTPADIPGDHAPDDPAVVSMIAAATGEIDGPFGWLRRAIGKQTLEIEGCYSGPWVELPLPPLIRIVGVYSSTTVDGTETIVDASLYRKERGRIIFNGWLTAHRIRYEAGFSEADGTGPIPWQVKQAVVMAVQNMKALGAENLFLRSEEVEGVGTFTYTVSDQAGNIIRDTARRLLSGLKVPRV